MRTTIVLAGLVLLSSAAASAAKPSSFETAMQPVLAEYLKIHRALAADKDAGVAQSAALIEKLASKLNPGRDAPRLASLPKELKAAAAKVRQAKGLAKAREAFKELSRSMVSWATASKPAGVHIVTCSMAKASWLQRETQVANPYYGAEMLRCGDLSRAR